MTQRSKSPRKVRGKRRSRTRLVLLVKEVGSENGSQLLYRALADKCCSTMDIPCHGRGSQCLNVTTARVDDQNHGLPEPIELFLLKIIQNSQEPISRTLLESL